MIRLISALLLLSLGGCDETADLLQTCEGGNTEACFQDARGMLELARPNYTQARKLLQQACMPTYAPGKGRPKENHPRACADLAKLVQDAKGGPRDMPRAVELYEIACRAGVAGSCVELGLAVYEPAKGDDVLEEPERAVELFFSACNKVDPASPPAADGESKVHPLAHACDALGRAYEEGKGVEKNKVDTAVAEQMYMKACDARYAPGCVHAGALFAKRRKRDAVAQAAQLFERGCRLDARHGCFDLAELHASKAWPDASPEKAGEYYRKTCNIDPTRGCFEAAELMEKGLVEQKEGEIESLYNLACEHGNAVACTRRRVQ